MTLVRQHRYYQSYTKSGIAHQNQTTKTKKKKHTEVRKKKERKHKANFRERDLKEFNE